MKKPTIAEVIISLCLIGIGFVPVILDGDATVLMFFVMCIIFTFFVK